MTKLDDLALLKDPDKWLNWPLMPLKKPGFIAVVMELGGEYALFRNANLFAMDKYEGSSEPTTPEELVEEGWLID